MYYHTNVRYGLKLLPGTALFVFAAPALLCSLSVSDSIGDAGHAAETSLPPKPTHTYIHKIYCRYPQ